MTMQYLWSKSGSADHDVVSRWVSRHSFGVDDNVWPDSTSCGVILDGKPIAGFIFHDYKPAAGTIQFSGAATDKRWSVGPTLHLLYSYMFDGIGCRMVTTGNSGENKGLHAILRRLGHTEYVIKGAWAEGVDLHFWTLTRDEWAANGIMRRSRKWAEGN